MNRAWTCELGVDERCVVVGTGVWMHKCGRVNGLFTY